MTTPIETSLQSIVNCKTCVEPDSKSLTHSRTHPVAGDTMYDEYSWVHPNKARCGRCGWSVSRVEEIYFQLRLSSGTNRSSELFLPLYKQTLQRKRKNTPRLIISHFPFNILYFFFLSLLCYIFSTICALVFITVKGVSIRAGQAVVFHMRICSCDFCKLICA